MDIEATLGRRLDGLGHRLDDIHGAMSAQEARIRESVAGIKNERQTVTPTTPAATLQLPGPQSGYMWDVRLITGTLSANDSVAAYIGDTATSNPRLVGYAPPPGTAPAQLKFIINPSSHGILVNPGELLFLATSGAGNITLALVSAIQFPAERIGIVIA